MIRIDILTLFPSMFDGFLNESIINRAIKRNLVQINVINFRDYTLDPHGKVDDTPYGGGAGMVLTPQPIFDAVEDLKTENTKVILLTPDGKTYNQEMAYSYSKEEHIILICGHYEGFDERIRTLADSEISIGDYVLTGGEIPSMVITDSITRLIDGVIEKESHEYDSFNNNLLDYPTYTKPRDFRGMKVPDVLTSGNHKEIEKYRLEQQIKRTKERRPDLLKEVIKDAS
ncbi:tRNA (guanine-N(1)-)-methyltransferase [Clostridium sp. CAG:710]|jgi:tRNA (guanine37-N1)-methyltransferase|nr:tRNA (guanine-N(1)-)-methyltransferase [Clostridium sp. CAG:710]